MVSYSEMRGQIEKIVSDYLKNVDDSLINTTEPDISFREGVTSIEFIVAGFTKGDIIATYDILKEFYIHCEIISTSDLDYSLVAHLTGNLSNDFDDKAYHTNIMTVSFGIDLSPGCSGEPMNAIVFEKEAELEQKEIDCFLEVWKNYALKEKKKVRSPKDILTGLGARVHEPNKEFTWDSIAGYEGLKQEIKDTIILPFQNQEVYQYIGELTRTNSKLNLPRAVLFKGPPGTGKTTMAKVIANESGLPLVYVPLESIMSMWYGVAEKTLAQIFDNTRRLEKGILFIDEIDSIGSKRGFYTNEATKKILAVLLSKLQGFVAVENVLTIGATNRDEDISEALFSRFNRIIDFPFANQKGREAIFKYYARHLESEDLRRLAGNTEKKSGRDIEDICSDAERIWASKIISKEVKPSAPPLGIYLEAVKNKFTNSKESNKIKGFSQD